MYFWGKKFKTLSGDKKVAQKRLDTISIIVLTRGSVSNDRVHLQSAFDI